MNEQDRHEGRSEPAREAGPGARSTWQEDGPPPPPADVVSSARWEEQAGRDGAPASAAAPMRTPPPPVPPPVPGPPTKPRPSATDAVVLPLWILGGQLLAGIAILPGMFFASDAEETINVLIAVSAILGWVAVVVGTALWLRHRGSWHPAWIHGHRPRSVWGPVGLGVAGAVGGLLTVQVVVGLLSWLTGAEPPEQEVFQLLDDPIIGWVLGLVAVLVAPVVEEIVFRGVVLDVMARRLGWWLAAVAQAAVFSAIHIETLASPTMFLALGLLGFVFAVLRRVTGSLVAPIVAHLVFNAMSLGFAVLM